MYRWCRDRYGSRSPSINRAWVDALMSTANTPVGLYIVPEPAEYEPSVAQSEDGGSHEAH